MNWQAFFDACLAAVALWTAVHGAAARPAVRLGCVLLGLAAVLGALRFSGLLPLPPLHQVMSMLGAGVGLPLLAMAVIAPASAVASQTRYAWIFAVSAGVLCMLMVVVAGIKVWASAWALLAVLAIAGFAGWHRHWVLFAAAVCMLAALVAFAAGVTAGVLVPGDFLHIGLAAGIALYGYAVHGVNPSAAKTAHAAFR